MLRNILTSDRKNVASWGPRRNADEAN